jgi:MoaA/NifB/PqqE/SkfB family radical SAM enzyme
MSVNRYKLNKTLVDLIRYVPTPARHAAIDLLNPLRVSHVRREKPIRWVTLFITNYCNARCEHCFYWNELNKKLPELNLEQLEKIFGSLKTRLRTLRLSGGEPFLYKSLPEFDGFIDRKRIANKMQIPTNGMLDIVPTVERMLEGRSFTHLNVSISLDGLEKHHDESRKVRNGFQKAIANIRRLVDLEKRVSRFHVSVGLSLNRYVALPRNGGKSEVEELIDFLRRDVGVPGGSITFDHVRSVETDAHGLPSKIRSSFGPPPKADEGSENRHNRTDDVQLSCNEMEEVNRRLERTLGSDADRQRFARLAYQLQTKREKRRIVDCLAGDVDCVIYPSGDVAMCEFTTPFANLHDFDYDLQRLWSSPAAEERRCMIRRCSCTHPCHMSDSMAYDAGFLKEYTSKP